MLLKLLSTLYYLIKPFFKDLSVQQALQMVYKPSSKMI